MFTTIKKSTVALLIAALMTPGLFMGIAPAKEAHAQLFSSGSILGVVYWIDADLLNGVIRSITGGVVATISEGTITLINGTVLGETAGTTITDVSGTTIGTISNNNVIIDSSVLNTINGITIPTNTTTNTTTETNPNVGVTGIGSDVTNTQTTSIIASNDTASSVGASSSAGGDIVSVATGAVTSAMVCMFGGKVAGFLTGVFGSALTSKFSSMMAVPTNEVNPTVLTPLNQTAMASEDLLYKECVLDPFAWAVKELIINAITSSIYDWINNGFEGGPVFLTDPEGFFRTVSFSALEGFLNNSSLPDELCEPFSRDIRILVNRTATTPNLGGLNSDHSCTLNEIFGSGFLSTPEIGYSTMVDDGNIDFEGGGIPAAMGLVVSGNNPFSAFFNTQSEASDRVGTQVSKQSSLLQMGNGYFSMRCDSNNDGEDEICTPGQFLTLQIDDWMGGGLSELEAADEVSEIINAIIAALVQKVLTDINSSGLLGGN